MQPIAQSGLALATLVATLATSIAVAGCGSASSEHAPTSTPAFATTPYTHQQQLVAQGAHLVITDGCTACHLNGANPKLAPSFAKLAGHRVTLKDGRRAVVDEQFLREALEHPASTEIEGYDPAPMIAALRRLHLNARPGEVDALVAFMEQIGPETATE